MGADRGEIAKTRRLSVVLGFGFVPYPPIGGAFQRGYHLLKRVAARHDIHLIAVRHKRQVHPGITVDDARSALLPLVRSLTIVDIARRTAMPYLQLNAVASLFRREPLTATLYDDPAIRETIARAVAERRPDVLHFESISLAGYVDLAGSARTVLSHQGAESVMMERRLAFEKNPLARGFYRHEARKLAAYEREMCSRFDANLVVSRSDGEALRQVGAVREFDVVANGVDVADVKPVQRRPGSRTLIFAGRLDQYANRDAIVHFVRTTWPLVRAAAPDARLLVVGANPTTDVLALQSVDSGVEVTGFVKEIRPYFEQAAAVVIPLRDGGGTRVKVLDALAMGMPIVSTPLGIDGLDLEPGNDVLVADTPQEFASRIWQLLEDPALCDRLAARARRSAEERFDWEGIAERLSDVYLRLTNGSRGARTAAAGRVEVAR